MSDVPQTWMNVWIRNPPPAFRTSAAPVIGRRALPLAAQRSEENVEHVHRLRIRSKKIRYTMEIVVQGS